MLKKCIAKIFLIYLLCSINQAKCDSSHVGIGALLGIGGTVAAKIVYDKFFIKEEVIKEEEIPGDEIDPDEIDQFDCIEVEDKRFDDFVGQDELVDKVKDFVEAVSFSDQYQEYGISRDKGLLLVGDVGSGKTELAHIIASELNALLIPVSADILMRDESEALEYYCEDLFNFAREIAKERKVVVLVDHVEKIDLPDLRDVLKRLFESIEDDNNIIFIGEMTISEYDSHSMSFDEGLMWELGLERFNIFPPNLPGRQKILEHCLKGYELDPSTDWPVVIEKLSRSLRGASFDFLHNFADRVKRVSVRKKSDVVKAECFEEVLWQLGVGNKSNIIQTERDLWITACHEAGHVLIASKVGREVYGASIAPGEKTLGMVYVIDDKTPGNRSKIDFMHDAMISLAGPCAEEIVIDCITDGCATDLDHASTYIGTMVSHLGMGDDDCEMVIDAYLRSERMKEAFDQCIVDTMQRCKSAVRMLLQRYHREHEALSKLLLEKEQLSAEEICEIIGQPVDEATELLV